MPTEPAPLADAVALAQPIVERVVWCTVTTVASDGQPRSRLMHPVWRWTGQPTALVSARPTPIKVAHLAAHPTVSCFYWDPAHDTVEVTAIAAWVPDGERGEVWEEIAATPPPVGFDPAIIWPEGPGSDDCAFLRFTATRIVATPAGRTGRRWTLSPGGGHAG